MPTSRPPVSWYSSAIIPSRPATMTSPRNGHDLTSRRIQATPASGGSIWTPAASMIFGIEPRVAIPMPPHAVQSRAMPRVSGRVRRKLLLILHIRSFAEL